MQLSEIANLVRDFNKERNWLNQEPNNLISSLMIELGELAEYYQWKNTFEDIDQSKKKEIAFEFVDVLFYLLELANKTGIDIEPYFIEKLEKLKIKYPPGINDADYIKVKAEYRKSGKNKTYA